MIKVAIDKKPLESGHKVRGVGFYTKLLSENLSKIKGLEIDVVNLDEVEEGKYDILHYQSFHPYFLTLPRTRKGKNIVTIHDLIPLVYPNRYPGGIKGKLIFAWQKHLFKNIDAVITVSETSKKDTVRFLGIDKKKIFPVLLAPREIFRKLKHGSWGGKIRKKYKLPKEFVLYVGDVNYNKNIINLAKAVKLAEKPLVIVGKQAANTNFDRNHTENQSFARFLDKYGEDKNIIRLGFVKDEDLVKIYNLATIYCQPSYYEGFGLPLLEAFACGAPVLASRIQAHVEVGENAAYFMNPKDAADMAKRIKKLFENNKMRDDFAERGYKRVKLYSWKITAKKTAEIYRKVANG